ncbi:MAG TPA: HAMP domain-containing sensor histidine kinase [Thermoanaerobaculia bacterium]|nr:HAMP domain-containing sensor histidine kinase [Thermoanaerobaculia bacterium]
MRRLFRRSILWLIPVILAALGTLLWMQYRFLRSLEKTSASAERNRVRNSLDEVATDIEAYYRTAAAKSLTMSGQAPDAAALGAHVQRNPLPGARSYFSIRFNGQASEWMFVGGDGVERKPASQEEIEAIKLASSPWHVAHKLRRLESRPSLRVDERDPRHRVIMRPVVDGDFHVAGVVGGVIDENRAREAMLRVGKMTLHERQHHDVALRIGPRFPILPSGRDFITRPLGFVFTDWKAGVADLCASPEEIAGARFRMNMLWTGSVTVAFFGAILLGMQAVARQMRLSQMKSEFVSNVSHELRTPLASIRVFGEYMRLGRVEKPEKIRQYGQYIEAESRRLTQLINNILDFSKIESAEKQYKFCETDVVELAAATVAAFAMPLREHGYSVTFTPPPYPLPPLPVDSDAFAQALMNLLDNAVKYSNGRKEIEVAVTSPAAEARVSVRDHGIGIEASEQKRIFEKFYRVGSGLVHDVKGSGLGLAIVSHVVKAHGGRVEVASAPGEGSTFTIVLPIGAPVSTPAPAQSKEEFA